MFRTKADSMYIQIFIQQLTTWINTNHLIQNVYTGNRYIYSIGIYRCVYVHACVVEMHYAAAKLLTGKTSFSFVTMMKWPTGEGVY